MAYRTALHSATGYSPFFMLYGREAILPYDLLQPNPEPSDDYSTDLIPRLTETWKNAREAIEKAQCSTLRQFNKSVTSHTFSVGDIVYAYTPRQIVGRSHKLARSYTGPYRITKLTATSAF